MNIGARVKFFRNLANISSKTLAQLVSLTPSQITNIETGFNKPSLDSLERICDALGITLAEFFAEPETEEPLQLKKLNYLVKRLTPEQLTSLVELAERYVQEHFDRNDLTKVSEYLKTYIQQPPIFTSFVEITNRIQDLAKRCKTTDDFESLIKYAGDLDYLVSSKEDIEKELIEMNMPRVKGYIDYSHTVERNTAHCLIKKLKSWLKKLPQNEIEFTNGILSNLLAKYPLET